MKTYPVEALSDPYPFLSDLREKGPIHQVQTPMQFAGWIVTRYEDAKALLADPRMSKVMPGFPGEDLLSADPPEHTRLRRLVQYAFTRRRVDQLKDIIRQAADELLDAADTDTDLLTAFAYPLPVRVISDLLGLDQDEVGRLDQLTRVFFIEDTEPQPEGRMSTAFVQEIVARKRAEPGEDLTSALIAAQDGDSRLSDKEIAAMVTLLIIAGFATTMNLIGNGVHALLTNDEQLKLLRDKPELMNGAVEETLRYECPFGPVIHAAAEDMTIAGTDIAQGDLVIIPLHSVNRDHRKFDSPDVFDITRDPNPHLAFSHGIHHCLGAPLARLEGSIAIQAVVDRRPVLAADPGWRADFIQRGLRTLPVTLRK
jgi:cytochrome P450